MCCKKTLNKVTKSPPSGSSDTFLTAVDEKTPNSINCKARRRKKRDICAPRGFETTQALAGRLLLEVFVLSIEHRLSSHLS